MTENERAYVVPDGEGEALWFAGALMTVKAAAERTDGRFAFIDQLVPPDYAAPLHLHRDEDEAWFILDGTVSFFCGEERFEATRYGWTLLPKAVPHAFRAGPAGARLLTMTAPAGFADFVREAGEPAGHQGLPPVAPLNMDKLAVAAARHGIELLGPPPIA